MPQDTNTNTTPQDDTPQQGVKICLNFGFLVKLANENKLGGLNGLFEPKKLEEAKYNGNPLDNECRALRMLRYYLVKKLYEDKLITLDLLLSLNETRATNIKPYKYDNENVIKLPTSDNCTQIIGYIIDRIFTHPGCEARADKFEITLRSSGEAVSWAKLKTERSDVYEYFVKQAAQGVGEPSYIPPGEGPKHPRNTIWAGAPGTGKSHSLNKDAKKQFKGNIMRVTFHPEYTYYDFVGTYRPKMSKTKTGEIEYAFVPGPFAKMLKKALWNKGTNYCLIIEEINRANTAAVFGDVFQLLDRASKDSEDGRVKQHESEYAICPSEELYEYLMDKQEGNKKMQGKRPSASIMNELRLPDNLFIWATMNSADQGVFPMDTAFKRRWSFVNMDIDPTRKANNGDLWDQLRRSINEILLEHHVQEDKLMGYYFLKEEERNSEENLKKALKEKVLLYLFEDAAKPFREKIFKKEHNTCEKLRNNLDMPEPDLGVFLKIVWNGIPQEQNPEGAIEPAAENVNNANKP